MKLCRTTQRTLLVLNLVAQSSEGITLSELGTRLDIPKSSLFDIVTTLHEMNYIRKHGKHFFIGAHSKKVGDAYEKKQDICDCAVSLLTEASEEFNASTSLVFYSKKNLDYCFQHHPKDAVRAAKHPTPYFFMHASAIGKVILASLAPCYCENFIAKQTLHKFTDRTIGSVDDLRIELDQVRSRGCAIDNREFDYMLQCVAAPIVSKGTASAAISFSGLNLFNNNPEKMIENVLQTARRISASSS